MKARINGVLYDTKAAILMADVKNMTALSGGVSIRLFKSYSGEWFQTVSPVKGNKQPAISNRISANTAKTWLEKHGCDLPLEVHFGISGKQLKLEHQIMVAERNTPYSLYSHDLVQIERLYHHPQKGWCLKKSKGPALIPLTLDDAVRVAKILQSDFGYIKTSLSSMQTYLSERE